MNIKVMSSATLFSTAIVEKYDALFTFLTSLILA